ncbi:MAG: hypothetical protein FWD53_09930 [Phycisphaerales bacterium]|nr:hypothetical protein [Phycisphaerales bacterium]
MRTLLILGVVVALLLLGLWIFRSFRTSTAKPDESPNSGERITSLVLLLKTPRSLSDRELQDAAGRAFKHVFGSEGEYVAAAMPREGFFIVRMPEMNMGVITMNSPYFTDVVAAADSIREFDVKRAIQDHSAWISVDVIGRPPSDGSAAIHGRLAKLIGQFAGPETLAIIRTKDGKIATYVPAFADALQRGDVDAIFDAEFPDFIIRAEGDDKELAVAEIDIRSDTSQGY